MKKKLLGIISLAIIMLGVCSASICQAADASTKEIEVSDVEYGYGHYVVTAKAVGVGGIYDEDFVEFWYLPVYPEIVIDEDTGEYYADLDYEPDTGMSDSAGDVSTITINIYDENGDLVATISPIEEPESHVRLPLADHNIPSGTYTAEVIAFDRDGNQLYEPYRVSFEYKVIPVPDTGKFFQNLNISKEDYLITGLIVFFVVGVVAFGIVWKGGKKTTVARNATSTTRSNNAKRSSSRAKANIARKPISAKKATTTRKATSTRKTSNAKKRR